MNSLHFKLKQQPSFDSWNHRARLVNLNGPFIGTYIGIRLVGLMAAEEVGAVVNFFVIEKCHFLSINARWTFTEHSGYSLRNVEYVRRPSGLQNGYCSSSGLLELQVYSNFNYIGGHKYQMCENHLCNKFINVINDFHAELF